MLNAPPSDLMPPQPTRVKKAKVWAHAEKLREAVGISSGFDIPDLFKQNNGIISYIDILDEEQTDAITVQPDGSFEVRLSSLTSSLRDNFTLAHELGHYVLHWPLVKEKNPGSGMRATRSVDSTNEELVRCEWEANWFASAFLMPSTEFSGLWARGKEQLVSSVLGVSEDAAKIRARTLALD